MSLHLPTPESFPAFPYHPPYPIQVQLMRHLYQSIEQKMVTVIESPTGTGKTLSLLCAGLTWLQDEKNRARKGEYDAVDSSIDWVVAQSMERRKRELESDEREYEQRLANARKKEMALKKMAKGRAVKKQKVNDERKEGSDDEHFLPEDETKDHDNVSPAVRALLQRIDKGFASRTTQSQEEPTCTKIYYASRTHSQLSQILPELRKLKLSPLHSSVTTPVSSSRIPLKRAISDAEEEENILKIYSRTVALGSRKQLCINDDLKARVKDLDEGCRSLLGEKAEKRCQYLPRVDDETSMIDFRDQILASPKDIEDLVNLGHMGNMCPYFASRRAIPQAELVTLPYNLLLSKTAREALGIDLTNQIVIIDEAHNLISTLLSLSTVRLPFHTLSASLDQVSIYLSKFRTRLSAIHALSLKRLVGFLSALKTYALKWKEEIMKKSSTKPAERIEVMTVVELVSKLGRKVDGVNLLEIEAYLKSSKVARKISSHADKIAAKGVPCESGNLTHGVTPPLHAVEAFLLALTAAKDDGRVMFSFSGNPSDAQLEIKYQPLNPSTHFREVVDVARSVVLAGGTMSPISDVVAQLLSHLSSERLSTFSCGHIIPTSNLLPLVVSKGPCGGELTFKHASRGSAALVTELGQIMLNFANIVPSGMVVFFPSYAFLNDVRAIWQQSGLMDKLNAKKKVLYEPQHTANVEAVLRDYAFEIQSLRLLPENGRKRGALLFAVVGAKLSEGLNFTDDLARAVIVVGLPFANLASPELRERMRYVNRAHPTKASSQKDAASELYENMCMNSVNQSVGRAIRHQADWSSVILIDQRYTSAAIRKKLPKWIGEGTVISQNFGQAMRELGQFYGRKR